jgi:hypothetical protein
MALRPASVRRTSTGRLASRSSRSISMWVGSKAPPGRIVIWITAGAIHSREIRAIWRSRSLHRCVYGEQGILRPWPIVPKRSLGLRVSRQGVSERIREDQSVSFELGFMTQPSQKVS